METLRYVKAGQKVIVLKGRNVKIGTKGTVVKFTNNPEWWHGGKNRNRVLLVDSQGCEFLT